MTILIAGDSWGCGEWPRGDQSDGSTVLHGGLAEYCQQAGYDIINLSRGGTSNLQIYRAIKGYLERYPDLEIDKIFVFQTEYTRDQGFTFDEDWTSILEADTLAGIWISRFYSFLADIAEESNCKIYIIGGCSDTIWLDNITDHYPGLHIACQSLTNLILNNNQQVDKPVLSWYSIGDVELINRIKKLLPATRINNLIELITLGYERENLLWANPKYFYPDGIHPNRLGHKILFNYLKEKNYL